MTWEYRGVVLGPSELKAFAETLNKFGAEGWELVTAVREEQLNVTVYWLKRPKA